jgi:3-hydroxyisobutyrate dehydrogenase-like beta-hydroxyacid dehydrogenase
MARRIVEDGFPLHVWARRPESLELLADTDARVSTTPAELGAESDVVGICVVADADVEEVLLRSDGVLAGMPAGGIVAIHSTVHPETCARLARRASERDITVVDAPVSGGGLVAAARNCWSWSGAMKGPSPAAGPSSRRSAIRCFISAR